MRLTGSSWTAVGVRAVGRLGHLPDTVGDGHVADDDPVDHEQRLGLAGDGRDAAQPDLQAAAGRARVGLDVGSRQLGLEGAVDGLGGDAVEVLGPHHRGAVGQVLLGDDRRALGEHHLGHDRGEDDGDGVLVGRDLNLLHRVGGAHHLDDDRSGRHPRDAEAAVSLGDGRDVAPAYQHDRAADRLARAGLFDHAGQCAIGAGFLRPGRPSLKEKKDPQQNRDNPEHSGSFSPSAERPAREARPECSGCIGGRVAEQDVVLN